MSKFVRYLLIGILLAIVIMQFVGPERPLVRTENPDDLMVNEEVSVGVVSILRNTCYDCHSYETNYPWYGYVAPVSWFLSNHVSHGREELNFSQWATFDKRTKIKLLKKVEEEVEEEEMPLSSYTRVHSKARLSQEERTALVEWADEFAKEIFSSKE